jgi:P2 family phage contractile tail tube protein
MLNLPAVLKGFNVFVDGIGYAGKCSKVTLPKLTRKTEDYQGGGLDAPIEMDMGLEKLTLDELLIDEINGSLLATFGAAKIDAVKIRIKGSVKAEDQTSETPVEIVLRGRWTEIEMGDFEKTKPGQSKFKAALTYYQLVKDGKTLIKIDVLNGEHINAAGKDLNAERRSNLGI